MANERPRITRGDPVVFALSAVSFPAALAFGSGVVHGQLRLGLYWVLMAAVHSVFALCAWSVARRTGPREGRRLFRHSTAAGVILICGDLIRVADVPATGAGAAEIALVVQQATVGAAVLVLVLGLLRHPLTVTSAGARARLRLDVATVMAGAATVGVWVVELPAGEVSLFWALETAIAVLLQPGLFLLVVFAVVRLALSGQSPFTRSAAAVLSAVAVFQGLLQGIPNSAYQSAALGGWLIAANLVGSALLAVGLRLQARGPSPGSPADRAPRQPYSVLPYAAMAVTWALSSGLLATRGLDSRTWLVCGGGYLTTVLVVFRQLTAFQHIAELLRERDRLTAKLTEQAFHDDLTGLPNRASFLRRMAELLTGGPVTVFLIDLNGFKPVNDRYGHLTGDQLLIEVGRRLRAAAQAGDVVARLGGDEFAVVTPGRTGHRLDDLTTALNGTVRVNEHDVQLSASIGFAEGTGRPQELLHGADLAMYRNKRAHQRRTDTTGVEPSTRGAPRR